MKELTSKEEYVKMSNAEGKVLVEIYAPSCGPCNVLKQNVLPDLEDEISIGTIDGTKHFEVLDIVKNVTGIPVTGVPVLMLYEDGRFIDRINGMTSVETIRSVLLSD